MMLKLLVKVTPAPSRWVHIYDGVDKKKKEDTDQAIINIIKNDLGEEIAIHDFDRTHLLGKRKLDNNVPQRVIAKFAKYIVHSRIFKTKKKLKGKIWALQKFWRRVIELKKREKCMILRMCDHMTVKFYF